MRMESIRIIEGPREVDIQVECALECFSRRPVAGWAGPYEAVCAVITAPVSARRLAPWRRAPLSQNDAGVSAARTALRHDWTREEIRRIYRQPLPDLLFSAQQAHREFHDPTRVQFCRLLSVKTGGCPEDCTYCPQSAHYSTEVSRGGLLPVNEVVEFAERARSEGATRFCMGAAWRQVQEGEDFENILVM